MILPGRTQRAAKEQILARTTQHGEQQRTSNRERDSQLRGSSLF
jgi:hypothetical protein